MFGRSARTPLRFVVSSKLGYFFGKNVKIYSTAKTHFHPWKSTSTENLSEKKHPSQLGVTAQQHRRSPFDSTANSQFTIIDDGSCETKNPMSVSERTLLPVERGLKEELLWMILVVESLL